MTKELAAYIGGLIAIAIGVGFFWFPPTAMAGQVATVGLATAFVVGGLATFSVTVAFPIAVREQAERQLAAAKAATPRVRRSRVPKVPAATGGGSTAQG